MSKIDYLFVRILEACNAGCFMCAYAKSSDRFRMSEDEWCMVLRAAQKAGVQYIRITGGEPLLHGALPKLLEMSHAANIRSSIITNGWLLSARMKELHKTFLNQIVVSLDSFLPNEHDRIRNTPGLFVKAIQGLRDARLCGIKTRVNSVCGPRNFQSMPGLQELLSQLGVDQWELSALKFDPQPRYGKQDRENIELVVNFIYTEGKAKGLLVPMGKIWCGNSTFERDLYFQHGIPPRPDDHCFMAARVRYLDAKNRRIYVCSLNPHRQLQMNDGVDFDSYSDFELNSRSIIKQESFFMMNGPNICKGCSSIAAGCSNAINQSSHPMDEWYY